MLNIKRIGIFFLFITASLTSSITAAQILSGNYGSSLNIAYNPDNKLITGYFEDYSGFDEKTAEAKFSCIFYLKGKAEKAETKIVTYYPIDNLDDTIRGTLISKDTKTISLKLDNDHGGCWNVMTFSFSPVDLSLDKEEKWLEIRYLETEKEYFYSNAEESAKTHSYLIKGNVIYIDTIQDKWVHATYYGKTTSSGWIKSDCLNH